MTQWYTHQAERRSLRLSLHAALWIGLIFAVCTAPAADADDSRPLLIEIHELDQGRYQIGLRVPPSVPTVNRPALVLPADCVASPSLERPAPSHERLNTGLDLAVYQCDQGLAGKEIGIRYPFSAPGISTVARIRFASGQTHTIVLAAGEDRIAIPSAESRTSVAGDYFMLGARHIWAGTDHLLFLVCLIFIAGTMTRVLATITGFTVAHSLTLALSALDVVQLPVPPIEAAIALSVVYLAVEVVKGRRDNISWRYPITVSSTFGLLHGLGFAAVLNEIGLPQRELVTGLLFFNLGVEAGQIIFAAVVMAALALVAAVIDDPERESQLPRPLQKSLGYAVGVVAMSWVFERVAGFAV